MSEMPQNLRSLSVEELRLDPINPRLPEDIRGGQQSKLLTYLYEREVLEELAQSMVDNGFFSHEPLIVVPEDDGYTVVEGNRRFASLTVLLQLPIARDAELDFDLRSPLTDGRRSELQRIPCWVASSRADVHRFLGFRHIGGLRRWSPEAKARYLTDEVMTVVEAGSTDPFREVGRRVGSNALGVRNPFTALGILRAGREQFGIDTKYVQRERFGVWNRCMNSPHLKEYIGLGDPRSFAEVVEALLRLSAEGLREVIDDLTPMNGRRAVLSDSRDVTVYAATLANEEARAVLREYNDLELASQVVLDAGLPKRIQDLVDRLDLILKDVHRFGNAELLMPPAEALFARSSTLRAAVRALDEDVDEGD